jgi:hypothetical protein
MFGGWIGKSVKALLVLVPVVAGGAAEIPKADFWQVPASRTKGWQVPLVRQMERLLASSQGMPPQRTEAPSLGVLEFPELRDHELCHWRALLSPPETGEYKFYISGDDGGALWISENET